ncbi:phenylalanine--tRNA ligase subunit alpha [Bacteroidota bacterium]
MLDEIQKIKQEAEKLLERIKSGEDLEKFKLEFLVKKGKIQALFDRMKEVSKEEKPLIGKELNILRKSVEQKFNNIKANFHKPTEASSDIDLSLPGRKGNRGTYHPVLRIMDEMIDIFRELGFTVAEGPDIEDEYYNFDALNFPPDHPARDMQDTFFIKSKDRNLVLRTHTSPVQIRMMQKQKPPIRSIMPGRVYRNEAINARSLAEFHQIEGLYINKKVTFAELKGTLMTFSKKMYGEDSKFRFRPSFFPFTEPSAELDISCFLCGGEGCKICKHTGWLEIAGCGMVHPNVLKAGGIDPEEYTGYAFGFGIERVAMLRTGIDDIRLFYENDLRVLKQL